MGPKVRFRTGLSLAVLTLACTWIVQPARASRPDDVALDASALVEMEAKVATAEPRDRCYLYTELLHDWTELAGRDMASGDAIAASAAMQHADADTAKLKAAIDRNSKRLKNAELLMEHSLHHLSDMLHASTTDQRDSVQAVLKHVTSVHDDLLAAVFSH